jgi:hypothetical protein
MVSKLFKQILWNESLYIAIAVIGFLSSIVSLFIDINSTISIKWLLFCIWLSLTVGIILIKIIFTIATVKEYSSEETKVIKYIADEQTFIITTGMILSFESLLSIYKNDKGYEELIAIGYVRNIQENGMIHVKIIQNKRDEKFPLKTLNALIFKTALSRQYVNIEAFE